jgi:DNA-binding transcriptional ArsR family regulator
MAGKLTADYPPTEVFRVLSDPIRWSIIVEVAKVDELSGITLERVLPVGGPTISYHMKLLLDTRLIRRRRAGHSFYYSLQRDVFADLLGVLRELASALPPGTAS